jgi:hypothetical protein
MAHTPYCELVGSLNYLAVATHPDIAYTVSLLISFLDCYQEEHWQAATQVLRYVKGTWSLFLTLGGDQSFSLSGYSDADFANCKDTSQSNSGYCYSFGSGVRYCTSALVSDPDPYPWVNYEHKLILRSLQVIKSPRLGAASQVPADKQVLVSN